MLVSCESYYVMADGDRLGPLSRRRLAAFFVTGAIKARDLACSASRPHWSPLSEVVDLHKLESLGHEIQRAEVRLASRRRRAAAFVLDQLIFYAVAMVGISVLAGIGIGGLQGFGHPGSHRTNATILVLASMIVITCILVWQMALLTRTGQTLGKRIAKVRVVGTDGKNPGFRRQMVRSILPVLLYVVPIFGVGTVIVGTLMILGGHRRTLFDRLAKTCVINSP
jgi:uncharacterized RDD family membrane protein YckC